MEEKEGVELNVSVVGWPSGLAGVRIGEQTFMIDKETMTVKMIGDPVWSLEELVATDDE